MSCTKKILLVDDEEMLVQLMQRFLELAGVEAVPFSDPRLALDWYSDHHQEICLSILDVKMAGLDGKACFERMLAINPDARVAFLSGMLDQQTQDTLMSLGARRFFQKPLRYPDLVDWVKEEIKEFSDS